MLCQVPNPYILQLSHLTCFSLLISSFILTSKYYHSHFAEEETDSDVNLPGSWSVTGTAVCF